MVEEACSEDEFIRLFESVGPHETARVLRVNLRNVYSRRDRIERRLDRKIVAPSTSPNRTRFESFYPKRIPLEVRDGIVIVGSDAHYWPGEVSTAHRGLVHLARELQPKALILNGDVFDGARISRHPAIGWTQKPSVQEELEAVDERTEEIRAAAPNAEKIWTIGNHDSRFENRLADKASEFDQVKGFMLKDHFPGWTFCISIWINDEVVVKHRFKGGIHATHNNTLWAGKSVVTGHLHSLKVTPLSDYNGTRWGVDTGTLAEPYGPQFEYSEDNPLNHRSGFNVLTFQDGRLLWPEVVQVVAEGQIDFRGQVIQVGE